MSLTTCRRVESSQDKRYKEGVVRAVLGNQEFPTLHLVVTLLQQCSKEQQLAVNNVSSSTFGMSLMSTPMLTKVGSPSVGSSNFMYPSGTQILVDSPSAQISSDRKEEDEDELLVVVVDGIAMRTAIATNGTGARRRIRRISESTNMSVAASHMVFLCRRRPQYHHINSTFSSWAVVVGSAMVHIFPIRTQSAT